jgi:hypothetical protein
MGKLGAAQARTPVKGHHTAVTSPVKTKDKPTITHQGGAGWVRKPKGELFLFATSNMVGEDTFYEGAAERDQRFRSLVHACTLKDPDWVARFVPYLRNSMQMRTASVVMAAESALARLEHRSATSEATVSIRELVSSALQRPDEPGEFVAYWVARTGKRTLPGGVQRGVADAVERLYTEKAALKYDGTGQPWRLGDVINLVHPKAKGDWQGELYTYLLDRRHHAADIRADLSKLPTIAARKALDELPQDQRTAFIGRPDTAEKLALAGMTWESLSSWVGGPLTAAVWESIIPSMGYMALMRNLRNFEQAGISKATVKAVCERLEDENEVLKSRQFPMRFLSAFKAVANVQWGPSLQAGLDASTKNVPVLAGKTLILVDLSGSMYGPMSGRSTLQRWEAAAVFGAALALRSEKATLVRFGTSSVEVPVPKGGSVLPLVRSMGEGMGGTSTEAAIRRHFAGHDRIVLLTDEQAGYGQNVERSVPEDVWLHTFNLAGYAPAGAQSGGDKRSAFGGLTDKGFQLIPMLESGSSESWPF